MESENFPYASKAVYVMNLPVYFGKVYSIVKMTLSREIVDKLIVSVKDEGNPDDINKYITGPNEKCALEEDFYSDSDYEEIDDLETLPAKSDSHHNNLNA